MERPHDMGMMSREAKQHLSFPPKLLQEGFALRLSEFSRDLETLQCNLSSKTAVVRAVDDAETAFCHDVAYLVGPGDHLADDTKSVPTHFTAHPNRIAARLKPR